MSDTRQKLCETLARLTTMSSAELKIEWARITKRPAPRVSPSMLRLALGYELQAKALGGLSRTSRRQLDQPGQRSLARPLVPGMRLVREWHGTVHVVTVHEDGGIHWNGRSWRSLSEIARTITGTRWSGPAFFGLKATKAPAA